MKNILIGIGMLVSVGIVSAQNSGDVLRYSFHNASGDARSLATGSALGGVGATIGGSFHNPAGIGLFRTNQFSGTIGFQNAVANTSYKSTDDRDQLGRLMLPNIGIVFSNLNFDKGKPAKDGLVAANIFFGYNKTMDANNNIKYNGINPQSSITDYFAELANDIPQNALGVGSPEGLAFETYLINPTGSQNQYEANLPEDAIMSQLGNFNNKGSLTKITIGLGLNFSDKFFAGANINFNRVRFEQNFSFEETSIMNVSPNRNLLYNANFESSGMGPSLQLGGIYKLNQNFRLAVNYETGSVLKLNDEYYWRMKSTNFNPQSSTPMDMTTDLAFFEYNVRVPSRISGGISYIAPGKGFLAFEIEQIKYGSGLLSSSTYSFSNENRSIKENFITANNYKFGAEYLLNEMIRLRAGYARVGSPFKKNFTDYNKSNTNNFSIGLGFMSKEYFIDFALIQSRFRRYDTPYTLAPNTRQFYTALIDYEITSGVLTVGMIF